MEHRDLIIIGSGSGNAIPEYLADWKITIVEKGVFGGTCLNVGCIPSKMFVVPADRALEITSSGHLGIHATLDRVDWTGIRDRVFGRIDAIAEGGRRYRASGSPNVELVEGHARFVGPHEIEVGDRRITADRILVAAGARPVIPAIPGLAETPHHTSDTIMRLDALPERLAILGGGFIAAEMGHVFSSLGSAVTVFARSGRLLKAHDREVSERFTEVFGQRVDLRLESVPTRIVQVDGEVHIEVDGATMAFDQLLVATGRWPNSDLLDVDKAGLAVNADGTIVVDRTMATSTPGVWAVGDIANPYQLKHLANREAAAAFWNMAHPDEPQTVDIRVLPHAVFSNPRVAAVGLTEETAIETGHEVVVGRRAYGDIAYGWALEDTTSFAKVVIDRKTGLILGGHVIGSGAADLVQVLTQAMKFGQTARELAEDVYYIHPALTEVIENALLDGVERLTRSENG